MHFKNKAMFPWGGSTCDSGTELALDEKAMGLMAAGARGAGLWPCLHTVASVSTGGAHEPKD